MPGGGRPYVAEIRSSEQTLRKLRSKHDVSFTEVREAVLLDAFDSHRWNLDPKRGPRVYLWGTTADGRGLKVVLYPVDEEDGTWALGTAWPELP